MGGWSAAAIVLVILGVMPVAWRRVAPEAAALVATTAVAALEALLPASSGYLAAYVAMLVTLFTRANAPASAWPWPRSGPLGLGGPRAPFIGDFAYAAVLVATAWSAGGLVGAHRRQTARLRTQLASLE